MANTQTFRLITLWQLLWYVVTVMMRVHDGYSITTLELTTVTFAVVMFATSAFWFCKPQVNGVKCLTTTNECTVASIRDYARHHVSFNLFFIVKPLRLYDHDT